MTTDLDLLERWRAGDGAAGNALFQKHFDSIYRFFASKVAGDIDELVQATFLSCVRGRDQFRGQSSFRTYLFTIARHELYAWLRQRRRDQDRLDLDEVSVMDLGTSPTGHLARGQEQELLLHALRSLPVEQQVLLELFYWEDLDAHQLAEVFGIEHAAMRARLSRARATLRDLLAAAARQGIPAAAERSVADLDEWARKMRAQAPGAANKRKP